jgi:hypothetical protein
MSFPVSLPYDLPPIDLLPPAADAAGRTSSYVSLRNAIRAWIVVTVNQGNAATVALTPLQATNSSGSGSKAIGGADATTPIWLTNDTSTATGSDALVAQTAAASFTTDATTKNKQVIFQLDPAAIMDLTNGFDHLAIQTGASNAANITSAKLFILNSYRGASAPSSYV